MTMNADCARLGFDSILPATRRQFLMRSAGGIGGVALAWLLQQDELLATPPGVPRQEAAFDLKARSPHFPARASAMISLFMHGGPSHIDLFDPKTELTRRDGTDYPGEIKYSFVNRASKRLMGSPWKFARHGECGMDVSELLPHFSEIVDEVCLIRSMHTGINGHEASIWYMNTGKSEPGRPAFGSWLTYGLGSESQDLPAYVVLTDPEGHPVDGVRNWSHGWLASTFQGTVIRSQEPRILDLEPPAHLAGTIQRRNLAYLEEINRRHLARHPGEQDLEARIATYELAARMQTAAREALDISRETQATRNLYGLDDPETREYGTRCLIARRLVERGVRFVQLFLAYQPWDNHNDIRKTLPAIARRTDKPSAALVKDLRSRGLLDSTLVHWGGEIGRLPVIEGEPDKAGRDHNGQGFSTWLAGGGVRRGKIHGATDEFGHRAVVDPVSANDYQATVMHLFGMDHDRLIYHYNGREQKLTDNRPCRVVQEIVDA
jgi:hypothetical protein